MEGRASLKLTGVELTGLTQGRLELAAVEVLAAGLHISGRIGLGTTRPMPG